MKYNEYIKSALCIFKSNKNATMDGYIMVIVNMMSFFVTISCDMKYTNVEYIHSRTANNILK